MKQQSTNHTHSLPLGGVGGWLQSTIRRHSPLLGGVGGGLLHSLPLGGAGGGLRLLKARIAYYYAKLKAGRLNKLTGRRYFVLMTDGGKLMVMDKAVFYKLRKRGSMPRHVTPRMLPRISVWYTAGTYKGRPSPPMPRKAALVKKHRYLAYVRSLGRKPR